MQDRTKSQSAFTRKLTVLTRIFGFGATLAYITALLLVKRYSNTSFPQAPIFEEEPILKKYTKSIYFFFYNISILNAIYFPSSKLCPWVRNETWKGRTHAFFGKREHVAHFRLIFFTKDEERGTNNGPAMLSPTRIQFKEAHIFKLSFY